MTLAINSRVLRTKKLCVIIFTWSKMLSLFNFLLCIYHLVSHLLMNVELPLLERITHICTIIENKTNVGGKTEVFSTIST